MGITRTYSDAIPRMTIEQWQAEARRLFGDDAGKWKFKCPICGHVQTAEDFRQFKDKGATPDSAAQQCIGRFMPKPVYHGFGENRPGAPKKPCDYAVFGLFSLPGVIVVPPEGDPIAVFAFAEGD